MLRPRAARAGGASRIRTPVRRQMMGKVVVDMSVSLDGFGAGPEPSVENPMGVGGERLHVVPVLLGAGARPFEHLGPEAIELEQTELIASPQATHLRFHVVKHEPMQS